MRSELVMDALQHVSNRYQLTRLTSKAVRAFHRPNTRIADTVNDALLQFSRSNPPGSRAGTQGDRTAEPARTSGIRGPVPLTVCSQEAHSSLSTSPAPAWRTGLIGDKDFCLDVSGIPSEH